MQLMLVGVLLWIANVSTQSLECLDFDYCVEEHGCDGCVQMFGGFDDNHPCLRRCSGRGSGTSSITTTSSQNVGWDLAGNTPRYTPAELTSALLNIVSTHSKRTDVHLAALRGPATRWFDKIMPYDFDFLIAADSEERNRIIQLAEAAMGEIESRSCFSFRPCRFSDDHCVVFTITANSSCHSAIGRTGVPRQVIALGTPCTHSSEAPFNRWRIVHQIMHAMGFWHEHCRPDRDKFVLVNKDNIKEKWRQSYEKAGQLDVTTLNIPYDYNSLLHFSVDANAIHKHMPVMQTLQNTNGARIGHEDHLSVKDVLRINKLYKCRGTIGTPPTTPTTIPTDTTPTTTTIGTTTTQPPLPRWSTPVDGCLLGDERQDYERVLPNIASIQQCQDQCDLYMTVKATDTQSAPIFRCVSVDFELLNGNCHLQRLNKRTARNIKGIRFEMPCSFVVQYSERLNFY